MDISSKSKNKMYLFGVIVTSFLIHFYFINSGILLVQEAYYWNYAQHLDWSYLDHPPMVAILIKCSTLILGNNELGVRITNIICLVLTAFFSYRLTQLINKGAELYAVLLLAVLPFFFIQTLVITPDVPLLTCWSASLYYLYRTIILNESRCWYAAGVWVGLGMLSKYTISLLGLAALYYVITTPAARYWFKRKEPYLCMLIAFVLFSPVIYWNATHDWISFWFQSSRRVQATSSTSVHYVVGLLVLFIMPMGIHGLWELVRPNTSLKPDINKDAKRFMSIFILVPLSIFIVFSLNHKIKFNWIGPLFLALIPWLALLMTHFPKIHTIWVRASIFLLILYTSAFLFFNFHTSEIIQKKFFRSLVAWNQLTQSFNELAEKIETDTHLAPTFVPLDNYHIGSELEFYQNKLLGLGIIGKKYSVVGSHIFGEDSLMYKFWSKEEDYIGKPLILISTNPDYIDTALLGKKVREIISTHTIASYGQKQNVLGRPYYYKVVQMNG